MRRSMRGCSAGCAALVRSSPARPLADPYASVPPGSSRGRQGVQARSPFWNPTNEPRRRSAPSHRELNYKGTKNPTGHEEDHRNLVALVRWWCCFRCAADRPVSVNWWLRRNACVSRQRALATSARGRGRARRHRPDQHGGRAWITILSTTDLHGNLLPVRLLHRAAGRARSSLVASVVRRARLEENPAGTLLVDSGDVVKGAPLE